MSSASNPRAISLIAGRYSGGGVDGGLVDRERGLDADARRVRHGEEPALEAFVEDAPAGFFGERLLAFLVAHEIEADEKPRAAHVADERVALGPTRYQF